MSWLISPVGNVHFIGIDGISLCGRWTLGPGTVTHEDGAVARCHLCEEMTLPADPEKPVRQRSTRRKAAERAQAIAAVKASNPEMTWRELGARFGMTVQMVRHAVRTAAPRVKNDTVDAEGDLSH